MSKKRARKLAPRTQDEQLGRPSPLDDMTPEELLAFADLAWERHKRGEPPDWEADLALLAAD